MNLAHLHLLSVHIPVVALPLLLVFLVLSLRIDSRVLRWSALIGLGLVALTTIPIFLTGEGAEEIVEGIAGIQESAVEAHESFATMSLVGVLTAGGAALLTFVSELRSLRLAPVLLRSTILLTCLSAGLLALAANAGGKIRHGEELLLGGTKLEVRDDD